MSNTSFGDIAMCLLSAHIISCQTVTNINHTFETSDEILDFSIIQE